MSTQASSFKRFVEVGRVVLVNDNDSPINDKLAVIAEIIDANRAIIDGPTTGVARQALQFKYLILTKFVIKDLPRAARSKVVAKYFTKAGVTEKWAATQWAKTIGARQAKKSVSDFERFEIMQLKQQRRKLLGQELKKTRA